jgi:hypothetical protein
LSWKEQPGFILTLDSNKQLFCSPADANTDIGPDGLATDDACDKGGDALGQWMARLATEGLLSSFVAIRALDDALDDRPSPVNVTTSSGEASPCTTNGRTSGSSGFIEVDEKGEIIRGLPPLHGDTQMLTPWLVMRMLRHLPNAIRDKTWRLKYSSVHHGGLFRTFYDSVGASFPSLLIVRTVQVGDISGLPFCIELVLTRLISLTELVLVALTFLTEIVLSGLMFRTELFLTALTCLTELVLTRLTFLTELALTVLTFLTELVLTGLMFRGELFLAVLTCLTELVLTVLIFRTELVPTVLTCVTEIILTILIFLSY